MKLNSSKYLCKILSFSHSVSIQTVVPWVVTRILWWMELTFGGMCYFYLQGRVRSSYTRNLNKQWSLRTKDGITHPGQEIQIARTRL
jgi:hypothetical protein